MKIGSCKVGGFVYEISTNPDVILEGNNCYGSTHFRSGKIILDTTTSPAQVDNTLVHEILHTLVYQQGLHKEVLKEKEEEVVNALANGLHAFFVDNGLMDKVRSEILR